MSELKAAICSAARAALQMMGFAGRSASMSGTVCVNAFVKEDGGWKYRTDPAYNTWVITDDGGWARQTRGTPPGPNKTVPPDRPPRLAFEAFPEVVDAPWNYKNPVTGR